MTKIESNNNIAFEKLASKQGPKEAFNSMVKELDMAALIKTPGAYPAAMDKVMARMEKMSSGDLESIRDLAEKGLKSDPDNRSLQDILGMADETLFIRKGPILCRVPDIDMKPPKDITDLKKDIKTKDFDKPDVKFELQENLKKLVDN